MSYFAKPNFIIYDEWFDEELENKKVFFQNRKPNTISNLHEFFYEKSNYKIGASENYLKSELKVNEKELITKNYFGNYLEKHFFISSKKYRFIKKFTNSKLKFKNTKKLILTLSILGSAFIVGFLFFYISESTDNESKITHNLLINKNNFSVLKRSL